jgi:hypothetical protein
VLARLEPQPGAVTARILRPHGLSQLAKLLFCLHCGTPPASVFFRRKLRQKVRPVPSNNAAHFVIDSSYDFGAFLDLSADQFEFLGTEGAIV